MSPWEEVEKDPEFSTLAPQDKAALFDDWHKSTVEEFHKDLDPEQIDSAGMRGFLASGQAKRKELLGEDDSGYPVISSKDAGVDDYLKQNPHVAGMAWGGGENGTDPNSERTVIVNPYNQYMSDPEKRRGLIALESGRHKMSETGYNPNFEITPEQQKWRKGLGIYATDDKAFRQSIVSRLMVGDDVPGATKEQQAEADRFNQTLKDHTIGKAVKEFVQSLQARSKAQQRTLNDYDELEKAEFALKDAGLAQQFMSGFGESEAGSAPQEATENRQKEVEAIRSRFTPELEKQAKEAREALRGERPAAVLGSDIYTDPSLVLDKEKYRQAIQSTNASPEAKLLALADYNTRRDDFAKKALTTFNVAGESPVPGMTSFSKWESEQPADVRAKTPEAKALDYMRAMQARPDFRKLVSAVGTGAIQGGADVAGQGIGLAAMASGSDALAKKAGEVEQGTQAISDVQKLEGDNTATGATTLGGISRLGVGMAPAIGAGVVSGGSLTAAALAAGAQTAGAQFPTTYNAMIEQGKTPEEALSASRGAAVLSGGITSALTAMGGYNGVEALIRRGGMEAARSKLKAVLLTGPLKEIIEELPDEQASQIIESSLTNPDKPVSQVVDEFMAKAPDLALQVGLLGGAGEAFSKQGAPATPAVHAEQQRTPVNSAGLGRTVGEVVAEAEALKAKAQQQAVESGSPLLAQAIAENVAAPTPVAPAEETGTTVPGLNQEPEAAAEVATETLPEQEVKATTEQDTDINDLLESSLALDEAGRSVEDENGDRDKAATKAKYEKQAKDAGVTVEQLHDQRAKEKVRLAEELHDRLKEGDVIEYERTDAKGAKKQKYRVEVDPKTGRKYLLDITEGSPAEGFKRGINANTTTELSAAHTSGSLKITSRKAGKTSPTTNAATPLEQGGSNQHAGESRTPAEGSISDVTTGKMADNKPLSTIDPSVQGVVTLQPEQLAALTPNPAEIEQAIQDNQTPARESMDLSKADPIMVIRQKDGTLKVAQGHHRLARALRDNAPLRVDIQNEVSTKPLKSIPDRINESSLSPRTTYPTLVQDIKNLTGNTASKLQEVADALLPEPMTRPTAEKIARRLMEDNAVQREAGAARERALERELIGEEKAQRGDERPVSDDKAPVTQGDFVTWQDENGAMQEGVLTKVNAGRGSLGEPVSEVTLEDSQTVTVPRRELQPLMASNRGNPVQAARAEAIESLRGHLGKEVSVGVSAVDAINGAAELQGDVPGVQKAWVGTRAEFLADEGLRKAFPQVNFALTSKQSDRFEGLFSGGRAFVFTDQVGIYEADIESAAEQEDTSPGQAAVQRVIRHEALVHRGFYALDKPTRRALFQWGAQNIYEGEMDAKAEEYGAGGNWRTDEGSREFLMEEIMAKMIERLKAPPKSGPMKQLWDILAAIWRKLTGRSREVTLKDIHDVAKLLRTALELAENNVQTRDGMPIKVEVVKPSMAGERGALDAEYMAAVESGDVAKQQAMVDAAAKAAGYETEAWHSTRSKDKIVTFNTRSKSMNSLGLLGEMEVTREAVFFTTDEAFADAFGGSVNKYFLNTDEVYDATKYVQERSIRERFMDWLGPNVPSKDPESGLDLSDKAKYAHHLWQFFDGELGEKFREFLTEEGITGVKFEESTEDAKTGDDVEGTTIAVFSPNQIKSAEPVTRDTDGNVIPLSQRFNTESNDIRFSVRPTYTSPLDQTLANTAKAVRLMRDGPPAVPVNLQEVYRKAQVGKSSAMVSLDDLFAEAKKAHPDLTEAEFGQQVQALYDDNGAFIEPADSPTVMREAGEKYNVRMLGVPASYVMVLSDEPVRASVRPEQDAEYMQAVKDGDVAKQQAMVDAAAKAAGYDVKAWHGSPDEDFTIFQKPEKEADEDGFWFSKDRDWASKFGPTRLFFIKDAKTWGGDDFVVKNPNSIKSADPITRDADGNVIPLSQRFNTESNDIRFSLAPETATRLNRAENTSPINSAPFTLPEEVAAKLQRWVEWATKEGPMIVDSDQVSIKGRKVHDFPRRSYQANKLTADTIVEYVLEAGVPLDRVVHALNDPSLIGQIGYDLTIYEAMLARVMLRQQQQEGFSVAGKDKEAFGSWEKTGEGTGRAQGFRNLIQQDPEFMGMFLFAGIKKAHQQQANDIAEANADIKADEVKKLDAESGRTAAQELSESAEEAMFRAGEEALSKENKTLWQKAKDLITRIGASMQILAARKAKNGAETKPSARGTITQADLDALNKMSDADLMASIEKDQKALREVLKGLTGTKADGGATNRRVATLVNRLSEQLGVPTDITSAVEALTASQDSLKSQFEQSIVDSLVGKVRSAITPKKAPSKNLNSVIKQITRILADNLNLPKTAGASESLGEKAIDAFGRVRNNEQLIREAWEKAREQIRATLAKRATEGLEGLTEEEAADIEQQLDDQLAAIAAEVPAHLWARGQAFSVLRDALAETAFDNNEKIMDNPEGALKAAQDKINEAVEKVGNVDPARWVSNQSYIIAAFNQLVADLRAAKARSNARRRAAQRAGVFSPAETETFNRLMDSARKRSGDKTPLLPENISWGKLFSSSPQSQEAKAKSMMEYMKADPVLSNLTAAEQQELADMFAKQWEAKRTALTKAKVAAVLKRRHATEKGKEAVKGAIPKFIQAINRGELNNDIIAQDIAEKFGFQKLTDDENKKLETLAKELQQPDIPVHERRAKTDEIVKIIARKTRLSTAEILSAWWVTSVLSGPRTIFTIGMAFLSGGFEVFTHAMATVINAHLQGRRSEGTDAAMQSITNYFKSYPRAVQLAWQYVRTGDKNLLADSDPAFMQFFDTGRNNPQSIGWRMTQSKNPATRMLGRFMHFFEKMLTAGDLFNSTITRHGMLPVAMFLNSKTYEKARVASETDLASYRKKALDQWWGGTEPKNGQQQALVTRQAIDLMEAVLAKYANVLEDANFVAAQGAMTLNPEGLGGGFYKWVRGTANRAENASTKYAKYVDKLKAEEVGALNKKTQQTIAVLYHFATHQMLNVAGLRFARFAGNKLNQSIGFVPLLGLARLYEKDYAGQTKSQAIIKNQVIGAVIAMVGITILKAVSDEPDDEKRGWGIEGSWAGLSADKIKQLMAAGLKQNSVHFWGHTFNYANWPISSVLAAFGAMADRIKYNPKDWKEASSPEVAYTGLWAALKSTFETTALSQLAEIFGSNIHSRDPVDASMKQMSRIFGNFAGGFVPRIFKDADLLQDGKLRKYEGWENFAKEIPYYRRYVGGPLLDIFGKQVEVSSTPWSREYLAQPEAKEYRLLGQLGSNGLWLTPADPANRRVGRGKRSREMTDAEQKRFVTIVGNNYRDLVLKHGERLTKMPHENAKELMGKLSAAARDRAERAALVAPATQP